MYVFDKVYCLIHNNLISNIIVLMVNPAFAEVTSVSLEKSFYTDEEGFVFQT